MIRGWLDKLRNPLIVVNDTNEINDLGGYKRKEFFGKNRVFSQYFSVFESKNRSQQFGRSNLPFLNNSCPFSAFLEKCENICEYNTLDFWCCVFPKLLNLNIFRPQKFWAIWSESIMLFSSLKTHLLPLELIFDTNDWYKRIDFIETNEIQTIWTFETNEKLEP